MTKTNNQSPCAVDDNYMSDPCIDGNRKGNHSAGHPDAACSAAGHPDAAGILSVADSAGSANTPGCSTGSALPATTFSERFMRWIGCRQVWGFLVSVVVMAALSLAFFYPDNFEGNDLRQHDMIQGLANSHELQEYHDATGETTRWTNSLFGGMPTFQIAPSYPSSNLYSWVTKVYGLGLPAPSNLLFMMMLGFMILMLALRIRWEYGLIGAIAWGFSTYFVIIIGAGHIWKFVTLAYIPPTIAGVMLAYRGRYLAGGAMAAFFAMMQLCSNHVQMTYYFCFVILGLVIAYFIYLLRRKQLKRFGIATATLAVAALLAVGANLPNLYHTSRYAKESQRAASELTADTSGGDSANRDFITQYSYGRSETFTLFIPNIKGGATVRPVAGRMNLMPLSDVSSASKYAYNQQVNSILRQVPQYFGEPEATNGPVYVGVVIFALFILGCIVVRGPMKWTLLVLTILSVLLAWGRNMMWLTDLFIDIVPLYKSFRTPESILVIAEFTIPLLAVMGLYKLCRLSTADYRKALKYVYVSFGVVALFCIVALVAPSVYGKGVTPGEEEVLLNYPDIYNAVADVRYSMVRADALRSLLYLAFGFGALLLPLVKSVHRGIAAAVLCVVVTVDMFTVNRRYIDHSSFVGGSRAVASAITPDAIDRELLADPDPDFRVLDVDDFSDPRRSYFHKMLGGYHAAKLGRYNDLINTGLIFSENVIDMLNARYIIYQGELHENPYALGNAWFVDNLEYVDGADAELRALADLDPAVKAVADRSFEPTLGKAGAVTFDDIISLTDYAPNRLEYEAESANGGVAVFSEIYFPWGWKAEVDGEEVPLARVNYVLRGLHLPAGHHTVVMTFDPASVHATDTVAIIAVIIIYAGLLAAILAAFGLIPCRRRK